MTMQNSKSLNNYLKAIHPVTFAMIGVCKIVLLLMFCVLFSFWVISQSRGYITEMLSVVDVLNLLFWPWALATFGLMIHTSLIVLAHRANILITDGIPFLLLTWLFPIFGFIIYFAAMSFQKDK